MAKKNSKAGSRAGVEAKIKAETASEKRDYDHPLKLIFSHAIMIENLIKGFVPEAWAKELDFSTLKSVNVSHITPDLRDRENDIIWQLNFRGRPLFVIFLVEFQSEISNFMAVRILTYVGLIYEDLIKSAKLKKEDKLPPVFPLVYYTGAKKWDAPLSLSECLDPAIPAGLMRYQPQIEYRIMDIGDISIAENSHLDNNLVSPLIELEKVDCQTHLQVVVAKIAQMFQGEQFNDLRRHLLSYIIKAAKLREKFPDIDLYDLHEVNDMLGPRLDRRDEELKQEARQEGFAIGEKKTRYEVAKMLASEVYGEVPKKIEQNLENFSDEEFKIFVRKMLSKKHEEVF